MTNKQREALNYIKEYLVSIVKERYGDFSEYAKKCPKTGKILSESALIKDIREDDDTAQWLFTEGLRLHLPERFLDTIEVEDYYDKDVYKVNDKFVSVEYSDNHIPIFEFVERKTKIVYYYE